MRVVLDTSVLVAALRSQSGASWAALEAARERRFRIAASQALFLEYEQVLKRAEPRLPEPVVNKVLENLAELADPVEIYFRWRPQLSDADDEMVFVAAVNGQADAIVTHNRRDFEQAARRFGIHVWSPAALLWALKEGETK
jgi:putative PIN family toxin of toxin-antitoxin system